ncbi:MAG: MBL fold metallo-hydrolase [Clostridia bacterium]|nr:MBL fold metallo-hydrolase [Clostridia bacterium]
MLNFCSLYSGSSGNSLFVQSDSTKVLVDCGVSSKKIEEALKQIEVDASSINAILVTHEHVDHVKGLSTFSSKYNIPIFANQETFDNMEKYITKVKDNNIKKFNVSENFTIGDLKISPFSIPHDAANPCGFNISDNHNKISIATDIGHMNNNLLKELEGSSFVLLESNYDTEVLKCCSYPFKLKSRISGPNGHLSNNIASKTISYLFKNGLKQAMLGHLSKESNFPELAYRTTIDELISNGIDENKVRLSVASREHPGNLITI